jgi:hypothetical protein
MALLRQLTPGRYNFLANFNQQANGLVTRPPMTAILNALLHPCRTHALAASQDR